MSNCLRFCSLFCQNCVFFSVDSKWYDINRVIFRTVFCRHLCFLLISSHLFRKQNDKFFFARVFGARKMHDTFKSNSAFSRVCEFSRFLAFIKNLLLVQKLGLECLELKFIYVKSAKFCERQSREPTFFRLHTFYAPDCHSGIYNDHGWI